MDRAKQVDDDPDDTQGYPFVLPRRLFALLVVATLVIAASLGVARLHLAFLFPGAVVLALVADPVDPLTGAWFGWRRPIDRRRVLVFLGVLCISLFGLAAVTFATENQIVIW